MPVHIESIVRRLNKADLVNAGRLAELAAESVRVEATRVPPEALPPGASRFGGAPDVPAEFEWPQRDGAPLTFLAQLDLAEVQAPELPDRGWLLFFYDAVEQPWGFDPQDAGCAAVRWIEAPREALRPHPHPALSDGSEPFLPCALEFTPTVDLPHEFDRVVTDAGIELSPADSEAYAGVDNALHGFPEGTTYHHLLGHPQLVQNDMRSECELVTNGISCGDPSGYESARAQELLRRPASDWQLLLQLDTDDDGPAWMWGDCGRLYFWIRRADLAARAFDRVWLILQCS